jgi:23S rRNA (guanosine2251-2'-O)-methyltransferase
MPRRTPNKGLANNPNARQLPGKKSSVVPPATLGKEASSGAMRPRPSLSAKTGGKRADASRWLYGRHTVAAALANPERRWYRLAVLPSHEQQARALIEGARAQRLGEGEPIEVLDHQGFLRILPDGAVHQGLALAVEPLAEPDLESLLQPAYPGATRSIVLVLDGISDPQNLGAVLRSAAAFGALAVVLAAHGSPPVSGALAKAASGAIETVPLVRVVNLARALDVLKEAGFWVCGLDEAAPQALTALDLGARVAIVLGSEGGGLRRLVRERCDYLARLPTRPEHPTLNLSNAAAVALYELLARQ